MNCRAALGEKHKIGHTTQTLGEKHTTHGYGRFQKYKDGLRMIFEAQKKPPSGSGQADIPVLPEFGNLEWLSVFIGHRKTSDNLFQRLSSSQRT